jgi:hypothetical protein
MSRPRPCHVAHSAGLVVTLTHEPAGSGPIGLRGRNEDFRGPRRTRTRRPHLANKKGPGLVTSTRSVSKDRPAGWLLGFVVSEDPRTGKGHEPLRCSRRPRTCQRGRAANSSALAHTLRGAVAGDSTSKNGGVSQRPDVRRGGGFLLRVYLPRRTPLESEVAQQF